MTAGLPGIVISTERLWTLSDGTACILAECDVAPRFAISIVQHAGVMRAQRLFTKASARIIGELWRGESAAAA